jgi:hypothetical protein
MSCDSVLVNDNSVSFNECADMDDLDLIAITKPNGLMDTVGTPQEISVIIKNWSDVNPFDNVDIFARIEDTNGVQIANTLTISENIDRINDGDTAFLYTFNNKYNVPDVYDYVIKVYISKRDNYQINDTITLPRKTTKVVGIRTFASADFTLEQNIPNPTNSITRIAYTIPESGEITFKVHTMNGQLLYNKVIQSESGKQFIELNTEDFAAGVYLYSIEYKGQKLVKRMSVKK